MTKVIKGEFEKLEDPMVQDVSLTCGTSLKVFNNEFNRMSEIDDDLFSYEVEVANIPCDSNKDDDTEQRVLREADIRGDNEVELTDEEFSDNEDEIAKVFSIDTNIFDFETPVCKAYKEFNYLLQIDPDLLTKDIEGFKTYDEYKDDWIYEWNRDVPWVDEKPWTETGVWTEPTPVKRYCKPFNYKTGCSEWPVVGIMKDTVIKETYLELTLLKTHSITKIMNDEEYVAVKEDEYNDLAKTSDDAYRAYQEIFRMIDEGWVVTRAE
ncbi:hypothetical protein Tco_1488750 [Tanacetum coccineum]